jgi:opacity protein-like surface antigen
MRKTWIVVSFLTFSFLLTSSAFAQGGLYLGIQAGYSAQKPSLKDVEFNTDTSFLYGFRVGLKFMMIALEANYFQAAHNLELRDFVTLDWGGRQIDYNYIGINFKYFMSFAVLHPYITAGYGYYTADIQDIDKDTEGGFNVGLGLELMLGKKFSLLAEGKYHHTKVDIQQKDLKIGDFSFSGGINIYF